MTCHVACPERQVSGEKIAREGLDMKRYRIRSRHRRNSLSTIRLLDSADQGMVLTYVFGWETFHDSWQGNLMPRVLEALMRFLVAGLHPNYCLVGVRFRTIW